ncbi:MAG: DUF4381 domain-containing protein [Gammaproteobacteria bacterium]|nr:DUF4381 domain-containing protein [Gammaproteobacteria bacterium]
MNPQFDPSQLPLRDIHLPEAVAWWPPAFGWWILAALVVVIGIVLGVRAWLQRRHRAARRALKDILSALEGGAEPAECVSDASIVLRRFAMTINGRSADVAGLAGEAWLEYLAEKTRDPEFATGSAQLLLDAPYRAAENVTMEQAQRVCRVCVDWINTQPARA